MFLIVNEIGEEATYQLGEMTRSFVLEQSKQLDQYAAIKERVVKYRSKFFPDNPILSRLRERVETLVYRGWKFSDKDNGGPSVQLPSGIRVRQPTAASIRRCAPTFRPCSCHEV
jgi:hypothetical protein